jgi:hypothetical protein
MQMRPDTQSELMEQDFFDLVTGCVQPKNNAAASPVQTNVCDLIMRRPGLTEDND